MPSLFSPPRPTGDEESQSPSYPRLSTVGRRSVGDTIPEPSLRTSTATLAAHDEGQGEEQKTVPSSPEHPDYSSSPHDLTDSNVGEKQPAGTLTDSNAAANPNITFDDQFLVTFSPDDPENPRNWSKLYRWYLTFATSFLVLNATFASSAPSGLVREMMFYFGVSREVGTLLISLFVAGYCVGPLVWGPLSEFIGRRPVFLISFPLYVCFQIGCALSPNTASILIFRLLGGAMAASPLTNSGSIMGDIWGPREIGAALATFTVAPFAGPSLAPMISGFMSVRGVSWRWIYWVLTIFSGVCFVIILFTIPETHAPTILKHKAERKRKETGDARWHTLAERSAKPSAGALTKAILLKPWKVLFSEPMLIAITVYMSFIYGCLYLLFEAYPIVFTLPQPFGHGFNAGVTGLMFLPLLIGGVISCIVAQVYYNPRYIVTADEYHAKGLSVPPEERLPMGVVGGILFTISFFWFGWTSYPSITFWAPMLAGGCLGVALTLTFLSLFNYIVDTYLPVVASALAANTVCRSAFGASFPLFATQMYETLNPRWASTLLGFIALAMAPIPILFIRFGPTLRAKSRYSAHA